TGSTSMGTFSINSPLGMRRRANTPRPLHLIRLTSIEGDCVNAIRSSWTGVPGVGSIVPALPTGVTINENHGALSRGEGDPMQIGVMNHPAQEPIAEIEWIGQNGFDFVDFTLEPPAAD